MNLMRYSLTFVLVLAAQWAAAQILQFHCINPTRADDRIQDMMAHVVSEAEKQEASTGDQLYYFMSGLNSECPAYSLEDCRRCANRVESDPPFSRELEFHWEKASAMFNEVDFIEKGALETSPWTYNRIEWHFYYGGDDLADAEEDILFIDPLIRISGTSIDDIYNRIFLHVPAAFEASTQQALSASPVLGSAPNVTIKPY